MSGKLAWTNDSESGDSTMEHNEAKEYYFLTDEDLRGLPEVMGEKNHYYIKDLEQVQAEKFGVEESARMIAVRREQRAKLVREASDGKFSTSFDHNPRRSVRMRKSRDFLHMG